METFNNFKRVRIFALVLFVVLLSSTNLIKANALSRSKVGRVVTVKGSSLTNQTITIVGNANKLYGGASYTVSNLIDFKAKLNDAISSYADSVTITYNGTTPLSIYPSGVSNVVKDVLQTGGNDYAKTLLSQWTASYTSPATPNFTVTYNFTYLEDATQRSQVSTEVARILGNVITPGMTDEQKEKAICDYIILNTAYDTTLVQHTAYAALFGNKKTVCQGYALLTYRMLTDAGLTARIVTGMGNGVAHAWNMVMINGNWYQLDNTWDDPIPDVVGRIRYDYFNLMDSQLKAKGHTWDTTTVPAYYPVASTVYTATDPDIISGGRTVDYKTTQPDVSKITILNNLTGTPDSVKITGLAAGDVIKVYNAASGGTPINTTTVAAGASSVSISITQLGTAAGSLYITDTSVNQFESDRTKADYIAEPKSTTLDASVITTINNTTGTSDTVKVTGLTAGDVIKVYRDGLATTALGSATVAAGATTATATITQLGTDAGSVYVTVTNSGKLESDRTKSDYIAEPVTNAPASGDITVTNLAGMADTIKVVNLSAGNTIKVYTAATGGTAVATAVVPAGATSATASATQLGSAAGSAYVTVTVAGKLESPRVQVSYAAEVKSTALDGSVITTTNNTTGISDTVKVTGLTAGDVIKAYRDGVATTALGSATVAAGATTATATITQLGTDAGSVYVTVTNSGKLESDRTKSDYIAEPVTDAPSAGDITVTNLAGMADTIKVVNLSAGNTIKVYTAATGGTAVATAVVPAGATSATASATQLGSAAGSAYVTVTVAGKLESPRVQVSYAAEVKSNALDGSVITTTNNATGTSDTVKVTGLTAGDVIKVYRDGLATTALGSATVVAGATTATATITQLGIDAGSVYVTVANSGKLESDRTKSDYIAEPVTNAPSAGDITVTNLAGMADTIKVVNLSVGNTIKVYTAATGGTAVATAVVPAGATSATASAAQLGSAAGSAYVTVTVAGKLESPRVQVSYAAEVKSNTLDGSVITTTNNTTGTADTVKVTGLTTGDVIKVYRDGLATTALGSATVAAGATTATATITQLGTDAGSVYVTVANSGKLESDRIKSDYIAEPVTDASTVTNVTISNYSDVQDVITVKGVTTGDIVKAYTQSSGGTAIATSKAVAAGRTIISFNVSQLGTTAGKIYITITNVGKLESKRIECAYDAEP